MAASQTSDRPPEAPAPPEAPKRHGTMADFREKWPTHAASTDVVGETISLGKLAEVTFMTPATDAFNGCVLETCIWEVGEETDDKQICAYYAAAMCCVFNILEPFFKDALKQIVADAKDTIVPASETLIEIDQQVPVAHQPRCLMLFAQMILVLFHNITPSTYANFITNRINALRAVIGMMSTETDLQAFEVDKAQVISTIMGANNCLKKLVLMKLIQVGSTDTQLGAVCANLCCTLAWTEMAGLVFICDMLLLTNSPVLRDPRVASEVMNLAVAFWLITASDYPQYFRILASNHEKMLLERSRFPTLIAVAQRLWAKIYTCASQFVTSVQSSSGLVNELVELHERAIKTNVPLPALQLLTSWSTDFTSSTSNPPDPPPPFISIFMEYMHKTHRNIGSWSSLGSRQNTTTHLIINGLARKPYLTSLSLTKATSNEKHHRRLWGLVLRIHLECIIDLIVGDVADDNIHRVVDGDSRGWKDGTDGVDGGRLLGALAGLFLYAIVGLDSGMDGRFSP
ncbi:hypothetical protein F0562_002017 [Nyssa sinensis]|uniref:Uncharacterized protein n=1 Tax=Nyssa sinensis TaxID=561372 RepID=A0A5J5C4L1_9ASTE|nr:hypothetical protein F0562_002017 [Nyssa sinensis]